MTTKFFLIVPLPLLVDPVDRTFRATAAAILRSVEDGSPLPFVEHPCHASIEKRENGECVGRLTLVEGSAVGRVDP